MGFGAAWGRSSSGKYRVGLRTGLRTSHEIRLSIFVFGQSGGAGGSGAGVKDNKLSTHQVAHYSHASL